MLTVVLVSVCSVSCSERRIGSSVGQRAKMCSSFLFLESGRLDLQNGHFLQVCLTGVKLKRSLYVISFSLHVEKVLCVLVKDSLQSVSL